MPTYILGVSMSNHDRSAALMKDGEIISAISEERLDRRKKSDGFYAKNDREIVLPPLASITYVLQQSGIELNQVDFLVCGRSIKSCKKELLKYVPIGKEKVIEADIPSHHLMHAYSAYGVSPFYESAVLVIDEQGHHVGDGRFEKVTLYHSKDSKLELIKSFYGDTNNLSLGMFYDIFAALIGLSEAGVPSAGKLMGLAPYGKKREYWGSLLDISRNGDIHINLARLDAFFSNILPFRKGMEEKSINSIQDFLYKYVPVDWNTQLAFDLAFKAQEELEKAIEAISLLLMGLTDSNNLSYAGGVALNCTANSKFKSHGWEDVFIQPAATDDGVAIGLCYYCWIERLGRKKSCQLFNPFLGKSYSNDEICSSIDKLGLLKYAVTVNPSESGAAFLGEEKVVGWFQGGSEWGPRALGARSILASPVQPLVVDKINKNIKYRESFRPFGVSIVPEEHSKIFEKNTYVKSLSPYMLNLAKAKGVLKEVRHVDGTVRFQEVKKEVQPLYFSLIKNVGDIIGVNAVLNTSFNVMGEPLVETPEDAVRQFLLSNIDVLIIGNYCIEKDKIPEKDILSLKKSLFDSSAVNLMRLVMSLEAAGFSNEALTLLEEHTIDLEDWNNRDKEMYYSFMLRQALKKNEQYKKKSQVEVYRNELMKMMNYPTGASLVLEAMEHSNDKNDVEIATLLSGVANQYDAYKFFKSLYSNKK
ncbi:carbamoyltransferase C-terminal domain-containing protein [Shouchella lonarensis]|uniref:Carbamoyltransferase n=1 Tax=Shouchella lonarensis TaxID=1464122 RepID=A0A1G6N1F7_9BACI|nr:carbamoyltransferase C-terminal domain-containing protein [Shouchella lonarensis]SDC61531.1 carbamoyltransferase [Shouchella lonarensis]